MSQDGVTPDEEAGLTARELPVSILQDEVDGAYLIRHILPIATQDLAHVDDRTDLMSARVERLFRLVHLCVRHGRVQEGVVDGFGDLRRRYAYRVLLRVGVGMSPHVKL